MVDGAFYGGVEGMRQFLLVDIMLVLPDADGLRVDFHEFGQRILNAAGDGDGTAYGDIVVRQFFFRQRGGGVDGGSGFVCDQVVNLFQMVLPDEIGGELLGLIGSGAIADGEQGDVVLSDEREDFPGGFFAFGVALCELQDAVVDDVSRRVDDGHLAAGPVAWIQSHDGLAGQRGLQKELAQVGAEDADGLRFGLLGESGANLTLQRWEEQTLVAVGDGVAQKAFPDGTAAVDVTEDALAVVLVIRGETDLEAAFFSPRLMARMRWDGRV